MKTIKLNNELCIGCGACTSICSEVFEFDDEGYAKVINDKKNYETLDDDLKEQVTDALEGCPVSAISVEETKEEVSDDLK